MIIGDEICSYSSYCRGHRFHRRMTQPIVNSIGNKWLFMAGLTCAWEAEGASVVGFWLRNFGECCLLPLFRSLCLTLLLLLLLWLLLLFKAEPFKLATCLALSFLSCGAAFWDSTCSRLICCLPSATNWANCASTSSESRLLARLLRFWFGFTIWFCVWLLSATLIKPLALCFSLRSFSAFAFPALSFSLPLAKIMLLLFEQEAFLASLSWLDC